MLDAAAQCWICDGTGRASLFADSTNDICAMCRGSGLVASMPSTTDEMVEAMVALPGIPRRTLTTDDLQRIDEIEEIVRQCLAEMDDEDEISRGPLPSA